MGIWKRSLNPANRSCGVIAIRFWDPEGGPVVPVAIQFFKHEAALGKNVCDTSLLKAVECVAMQENYTCSNWGHLTFDLLDLVNTMMEKSERDLHKKLQVMKALRLVNRHWSSWATEAINTLSPSTKHITLCTLTERVAAVFVNVSTLLVRDVHHVTADGSWGLRRLPNLTHLDLKGAQRIFDQALQFFGALTALRELDLGQESWIRGQDFLAITAVGMRHLARLNSLKRLSLRFTPTTDKDLEHLQPLTGLVELDLNSCYHITAVGVRYLTALQSLTNLNLGREETMEQRSLTDEAILPLTTLLSLQDLDLGANTRITASGLLSLAGLTALTRIGLWRCRCVTEITLTAFRDWTLLDVQE